MRERGATAADKDVAPATLINLHTTRQIVMPAIEVMAKLRADGTTEDEVATQTETLRFTYFAAMTSGVCMFANWLQEQGEGSHLVEKAMDFHASQAERFNTTALTFGLFANYCVETAVEQVERQGVHVLHEAFAHVLPPRAGPEYCYALSAVTAAIPPMLAYVNELLALLAWVDETAADQSDTPARAFTGITGSSIPPALRALWQQTRKR